jgi:hypothetical protein
MTNATIHDLINRLDTLPFDQAHTLVLHVLDQQPNMIEDDRIRRWVSANSRAILDVVRKRVERYEALGNAAQDMVLADSGITADGKSAPQTDRYNPTRNRRHPDTCQCPACRPFIYPRR